MHRSKIFGNSQIPAMVTNSILKLNCQLSKLINETMYTCSHILDSSVSKTIACRSNLSTLKTNEEYDQRKNVKELSACSYKKTVSQELQDA